jgi:HEAT repeat protein
MSNEDYMRDLIYELDDEVTGKLAALELVSMGRPAVPLLIQTLQFHLEARVRALAAWALGQINDPRSVPALIDALELEAVDRPVVSVSQRAAESLLLIGTPDALKAQRLWKEKAQSLNDRGDLFNDSSQD